MASSKAAEPIDGISNRAKKQRRTRLPLAVAAIVLVVMGLNYYFYVRSKTQYYTTRDLRLLAQLGRQVDDALKSHRQFVINFAEDRTVLAQRRFVYADLSADQRKIANRNFPGFNWMSRNRNDCRSDRLPPPGSHNEGFVEEIVEINGESWLRLAYQGARLGKLDPATNVRTRVEVVGCGEVKLAHVLQAAFRATIVEPFDTVMLVDETGTVLHRAASQHQSSARGFGAARTAHDAAYRRDVYGSNVDVRINSLSALSERSGWTSFKPFEVSSLGATRNAEVSIADRGYFLFAQPSPVSVARRKTVAPPTTANRADASQSPAEKNGEAKEEKKETVRAADPQWSLCALVAKRRFMYEALAVSETVVASVAGLLLLIVAAWPFMRLSLINEFKPVRIADVIFLAVSTTVAAAIFTIAIADAFVYRRLQAVTDVHLRQFAVALDRAFNMEILRALNALGHIEKTWDWKKEKTIPNAGSFELNDYMHKPLPETTIHPFDVYPFFSTFSWIDRNGVQAYKRSVYEPIPRVVVADRDYFLRVRDRRMWLTSASDRINPWPFAMESLRSMTTGKPEVIVARATKSEQFPVLAMTLTAAQLIDPVLPAGFTFAVIDDSGGVLFHSDTEKNGMENFFEESDQNRQFRSAVFARHASHVDLRYGGQDYRAYVTPMKHLPWMMIVLRHKQLLRTMNAETIVITMMCLVFLVAGAVVLTFIIVLLRPRYRAPWLWPDYDRGLDYVRLCFALLCLFLAGMVSVLYYESGALIIASFSLPPIALVTTFGALHQRRGWVFGATVLVWLALAATWMHALTWERQVTPGPVYADELGAWLAGAFLFAGGFLALKRYRGGTPALARAAHMVMAALLLLVIAIVPTLGFFKAAYRLGIQNLIKYSQLMLADRLQKRAETVIEAGYRPNTLFARRWEVPAAFNTRWWLLPPNERPPAAYNCKPSRESMLLPEFVEEFLPQYSEDSVAMREMHHDTASHQKWWWCRDGTMLALHKTIRLPPGILAKLWPDETPGKTISGPPPRRGGVLNQPGMHPLGQVDVRLGKPALIQAQNARADRVSQKIVVSSIVPSIIPPFLRPISPFPYPSVQEAGYLWQNSELPGDAPLSRALRIGTYAMAVGVAAACLWWALIFIARVVFLGDLREPMWLTARLRPRIGDPIFLFRKGGRDLDDVIGLGFHRVPSNQVATDYGLQRQLAQINALEPGSCVLVEAFEIGVSAEACARKLRLIEHVLRLPQRSIVIVSTMSPSAMVAIAQSAGADPEAWREILTRFIWISDDQLKPMGQSSIAIASAKSPTLQEELAELREGMRELAQSFRGEEQSVWLTREAAGDPLLKQIAEELEGDEFMSQAQVIDEFRERAASYYDMLWSSCSDGEKVILCQLALEGLLNAKNRRAIRRMIGRGLIKRRPHLSLLNESFRSYVLNASVAEAVDVKHVDDQDTWSAISRPLAFVLIAVIVMFLVTQKDLANTASAIVAALAGGVPALIKLIGILTDRKQSTA